MPYLPGLSHFKDRGGGEGISKMSGKLFLKAVMGLWNKMYVLWKKCYGISGRPASQNQIPSRSYYRELMMSDCETEKHSIKKWDEEAGTRWALIVTLSGWIDALCALSPHPCALTPDCSPDSRVEQERRIRGRPRRDRRGCWAALGALAGPGRLRAFLLCAGAGDAAWEHPARYALLPAQPAGSSCTSKGTERGQCQELSEVPPLNPQHS